MPGPWNQVDLETGMLPHYGAFFNVDRLTSSGEDDQFIDAGVAGFEVTPGQWYEFEITVVPDPDFITMVQDGYFSIYSQLPSDDPNASGWDTYYDDSAVPQAGGTFRGRFGPGREEYDAAILAGETHVLVETRMFEITALRWRTVEDALDDLHTTYGVPVVLDPTPNDPGDGSYVDYQDWYVAGAQVHPGVALTAWCTQGEEVYTFGARAVRWVMGEQRPEVEMGTGIDGPISFDLPINAFYATLPSWYNATDLKCYREVGQVITLGNGWAGIVAQQQSATQAVFAQLVHVNEETLDITLGDLVTDPANQRNPDGWLNPASYGDGRVMISGQYGNPSTPELGVAFIFFDTTVDPPTWETHFQVWNAVPTNPTEYSTWCDLGSLWLGIWNEGGNVAFHTFLDAGGRPDIDAGPTEVVAPFARGSGWDFDATYMLPMDGGLVYVFETDYGGFGGGRLQVLDTADWSLTIAGYTISTIQGFMGGLADWTSLGRIDGTQALFAYGTKFSGNPASDLIGGYVGIMDATHTIDSKNIFAWENSLFANPLYSVNNWEGIYLGDGKVLTIMMSDDDDTPRPGATAPYVPPSLITCPRVVPAYLPSLYVPSSPVASLVEQWGVIPS